MRRLLALLLPLMLLVSACSGSSGTSASPSAGSAGSVPAAHAEALDSVKVTAGAKGKAPAVSFSKPLKLDNESIKVVSKGSGEPIKAGQIVVLRQVAFNAEDGKQLGENFSKDAGQTFTFDANFQKQFPLVYNTFVGTPVGSFVAYGTPGVPAVAGSTAAPSQPAQPAALSIFQVESAKNPPSVLSSADVAKLEAAGGLPAVQFDAKGVPTVTIPKKDAPADLAVKVLSAGKGPKLTESDTIVANYSGWQWSNGKKFESTWDTKEPATFQLSGVIPGWTKGLTGQTVGSKVLLVIPAEMAYGNDEQSGKPTGPLVFVVEIVSKK